MYQVSRRTAAISAVAIGIALVGAGCTQSDKDKDHSSTASSSTSQSSTSSAAASTSEAPAAPATTITGADGQQYTVQGEILQKYDSLNQSQQQDLKTPKGNEQKTKDGTGSYQEFEGGVIIFKTGGPAYVVWGKIRDKWNELGGSGGELGYPTSDEVDTANAKVSTFEHGTLTWKIGDEEVTVAKK